MTRSLRPYLPGTSFHLYARTQGRAHYFDRPELKDRIVTFIARAAAETDVALLAFVVMSNHYHFVVRQGFMPLGRFMQSVSRRCALMVHGEFGIEGHVFEGPYQHRTCAAPDNLREWIRYVHRNPLRAHICDDLHQYKWSSHAAWANPELPELSHYPRLNVVRELFATSADRTTAEMCADYNAYVNDPDDFLHKKRRRRRDAWLAALEPGDHRPPDRPVRPDLRNVMAAGIATMCPGLNIEMVRTFQGAQMWQIRRRLIGLAAKAGHPGCKIAAYLHVSESLVSNVVRKAARNDKGDEIV